MGVRANFGNVAQVVDAFTLRPSGSPKEQNWQNNEEEEDRKEDTRGRRWAVTDGGGLSSTVCLGAVSRSASLGFSQDLDLFVTIDFDAREHCKPYGLFKSA